MNKLSDIGLIGLAVMGENLVLNMESKGFQVSVYNRSTQKVMISLQEELKIKRFLGLILLKNLSQHLQVQEK